MYFNPIFQIKKLSLSGVNNSFRSNDQWMQNWKVNSYLTFQSPCHYWQAVITDNREQLLFCICIMGRITLFCFQLHSKMWSCFFFFHIFTWRCAWKIKHPMLALSYTPFVWRPGNPASIHPSCIKHYEARKKTPPTEICKYHFLGVNNLLQ